MAERFDLTTSRRNGQRILLSIVRISEPAGLGDEELNPPPSSSAQEGAAPDARPRARSPRSALIADAGVVVVEAVRMGRDNTEPPEGNARTGQVGRHGMRITGWAGSQSALPDAPGRRCSPPEEAAQLSAGSSDVHTPRAGGLGLVLGGLQATGQVGVLAGELGVPLRRTVPDEGFVDAHASDEDFGPGRDGTWPSRAPLGDGAPRRPCQAEYTQCSSGLRTETLVRWAH